MKKIIIFLLIIGAGYHLWQRNRQTLDDKLNPEAIANPVYAETRVKMEFPGRSAEAIMFAKTVDQADCQKLVQTMERQLESQMQSVCPACKAPTSECKAELAPRYARLFDDAPAAVTYVSMARGQRSEREHRLIYWGVSVAESDRLCDMLPGFQKGRKGTVTCVRARRE